MERRNQLRAQATLLSKFHLEDKEYKNYLMIPPECFDKLVELVKDYITKKYSQRDAVLKLQLAATLPFKASSSELQKQSPGGIR